MHVTSLARGGGGVLGRFLCKLPCLEKVHFAVQNMFFWIDVIASLAAAMASSSSLTSVILSGEWADRGILCYVYVAVSFLKI